jgi:hypothetical protein
MVEANYNGKRARDVKLPKTVRTILALRRSNLKEGSLVVRPSFIHCDCPMCCMGDSRVATGDQLEESATRKPILSGEGSRDVTDSDVHTLTDVTTRPPMDDAEGAENLGAEILADGMSCPTV